MLHFNKILIYIHLFPYMDIISFLEKLSVFWYFSHTLRVVNVNLCARFGVVMRLKELNQNR